MRVLLPKTFVPAEELTGPLFFLAGPIRGGDDWQYQAVLKLKQHLPDFCAVVPNRYEPDHPLQASAIRGVQDRFERQTSWERYYLEAAGRKGCILFWLPCESKTRPRTDGSPYARDTYGELGEWRGRMMSDRSLRVVVGAEKTFAGLLVIQKNFEEALESPEYRIFSTLEETVAEAVVKTRNG
jgi:hypothetical protein